MNTTETALINATIDGHAVAVPKGTTVYQAAHQLGVDVPIFCYHDRMPPFGACRMCLVEVEKMPKLQASCCLELTEGMVVHTQSQIALDGRAGILEFLLINHPLDCPMCDKGGECPLQDQTLAHGPGASHFYEEKRKFPKPLALGPVLMLDRERCIACARCTRFGEHVAGDHALTFIDRGYHTEVGTPDGKPVRSKFIGNTIDICPVGALTSQVYRFRARPWDNTQVATTCTLCPVGCSMHLDSRDGQLLRTRPREDLAVNDVWLCDKGSFGYSFVNHPERLTTPLIRRNGVLVAAQWSEALTLVARRFKEAVPHGRLAGWGGNPLTVEENYLFQQLFRSGAGVGHLDHRIGMSLFGRDEEGIASGMECSLADCASLSYAFLLGLDVTEELPLLWLRLNQALQKGARGYFYGHYIPEIARYLQQTEVHPPGGELDALRKLRSALKKEAVEDQVGALFVGSQYLNSPQRRAILAELLELRYTYPNLTLNILEGRGNSHGARWAGMHPEWLPFGKPAPEAGLNYLQVLERASAKGWDYLHIAGADPRAKVPSALWSAARRNLSFLVVQDIFYTDTVADADVVFPVLAFPEKQGRFINVEGRVRNLKPGKLLPEHVPGDGELFVQIARHAEVVLRYDLPGLEEGQRLPHKLPEKLQPTNGSASAANGLRATFARRLFDQGVRMRHNKQLSQVVEEPTVRVNPTTAAAYKLNAGDRVQLVISGLSLHATLAVEPDVAPDTIVIPKGFEALSVKEWGADLRHGVSVEISKLGERYG